MMRSKIASAIGTVFGSPAIQSRREINETQRISNRRDHLTRLNPRRGREPALRRRRSMQRSEQITRHSEKAAAEPITGLGTINAPGSGDPRCRRIPGENSPIIVQQPDHPGNAVPEIGPAKSEEVADFATFLYRNLSAMAIRRHPAFHPGHPDHRGHRLTMHPVWIFQVSSSHPPRIAAAVPPELSLFVCLFDFRQLHGLREGQSQRVAVVGRGLAAKSSQRVDAVSWTTQAVRSLLPIPCPDAHRPTDGRHRSLTPSSG
jgi:hypothetical protein